MFFLLADLSASPVSKKTVFERLSLERNFIIMKALLLLTSILLLSACISYDGNSRLMIEGRLVDRDGSPISGTPVAVLAQKAGIYIPFVFYIPDVNNSINQQLTDSEGRFKMLFPEPIDAEEIVIAVNRSTLKYPANDKINNRTIFNVQVSNFNRNALSLGDLELFDVAQTTDLTIEMKPSSPVDRKGVRLRFEGLTLNQEDDFNRTMSGYTFSEVYQRLSVATNQFGVIYYDVVDFNDNVLYSNSRIIQIAEAPVTIEIEF